MYGDANDQQSEMTAQDQLGVKLDYIAAGGNRHPSAADWAPGLLAFGAGNNIALWDPEDSRQNGISALLQGHSDHVNAVKIYDTPQTRCIISGGADKTIRIWTPANAGYPPYEQMQSLTQHQGSVNTISILPAHGLFISGAADGTVIVWDLSDAGAKLIQSISLKPRYLPLATAVALLGDGAIVLAVAGTSSSIQLFVRASGSAEFELQATLSGHEGWIRSLDFVRLRDGDLLLASSSQDKYVRLWRFHKGANAQNVVINGVADPSLAAVKISLSNKAHQVGGPNCKYGVTFEALLIGHEDWIYTARWAPQTSGSNSPTLLSASADNSLSIWSADEASGVWICGARLGEISAQKGSTTATGSTGGFWIGLWQPDGRAVASLGRTGSWRRWQHDEESDIWVQQVGIGGHIQEVQSLAWASDGSYLLTTSADQTTRLFAEWKRDDQQSWHEFSRPQIHGYDLNCIDSVSANRFISGADEKLLRVFNKPKAIDHLLSKLSGISATVDGDLADAANIPVLGLSNKAVAALADDEPSNGIVNGNTDEREVVDPSYVVHKSALDLDHPPLEDHLARHTLWPEHEKLYGHGYEISAVAASHDGSRVATACKASSIDHAVIRLYETKEWREVKPPLAAHTLTVTSLAFSGDDRYLLSVGRDRQWAMFQRDAEDVDHFKSFVSNPKGHARMILDCSWAPVGCGYAFATAGRDKVVRIWKLTDGEAECTTTIAATTPVTAVAFAPTASAQRVCLAAGSEDGSIQLSWLHAGTFQLEKTTSLPPALCPSGAVTRLQWRPRGGSSETSELLAAASDDGSVRIINVSE
ncbi:hypothetical protein LTR36_002047 [Oleoguttula mirabilis]|uniref:Elongator complex protein 2 n=1 Tax=Oleoguttula mirabilis TaxID=1507867 RepID=A0AAV9JN45_9PEZI|nr:hypothetical protein LTR36_002047 [Oleoguttula mirabilis]